jgi:hypothetical protein
VAKNDPHRKVADRRITRVQRTRRPRRFLLLAVACVLLVSSSTAAPGDFWFDVNVASRHSSRDYRWRGQVQRFNQNNLGLGATYEVNCWCDVKGGFFRNSYDKTSVYAVGNAKWTLVTRPNWSLAPGVALGLVSGYQNTPEQTGEVAPWGMVSMTVGIGERWRVNLGYIPSRIFVSNSIDVATLQLSWRL